MHMKQICLSVGCTSFTGGCAHELLVGRVLICTYAFAATLLKFAS